MEKLEDLRIVPADTAEPLHNIEALADDIWHEHFTPILGEKQVDYMLEKYQTVDAINDQIMKGTEYFVLIYDYLMAGYISYRKDGDALLLSTLYIHEECRGHHIATNTIRFLIALCRQNHLSRICLSCHKKNTKALDVYRHLGFSITREQTADIGNGFVMDDYILEYQVEA